MTRIAVIIDEQPDWEAYAAAPDASCGAQVSFMGFVRQSAKRAGLTHLRIQHYPKLSESEILRVAQAAAERWPVLACTVAHRTGDIALGETIVGVWVSAAHRAAAFAACEYIMDYLKTEAPFWKQECFGDECVWVEAKSTDAAAAARWNSA